MNWCSRPSLAAALALLAATPPARAQAARETQVQALGIASRPAFGGVDAGLAWRDARRGRWLGAVSLGALGRGSVGARADLAWHFLLDPARRGGSAVYGGAGVSALAERSRVTPYVLIVLGAEQDPGGTGGAFVEIGVGGGVRAEAGYRWRKRNAPGR